MDVRSSTLAPTANQGATDILKDFFLDSVCASTAQPGHRPQVGPHGGAPGLPQALRRGVGPLLGFAGTLNSRASSAARHSGHATLSSPSTSASKMCSHLLH